MLRRIGAVLTVIALAACGGGNTGGGGAETEQTPAPPQAAPAESMPAAAVGEAPSGPIDEALASQGEQNFQMKGCVGCHTIGGGKLVGPDLKGVTDKQSYTWIVSMIQHPDSMVANDPVAKQLYQEYGTQMTPMGVNPSEARALYEYLRKNSQ